MFQGILPTKADSEKLKVEALAQAPSRRNIFPDADVCMQQDVKSGR
jgi:hypothetical protein